MGDYGTSPSLACHEALCDDPHITADSWTVAGVLRWVRPCRPLSIEPMTQLVVFRLDEQRYALPLGVVERAIRAVEVTPLPQAPPIVLGAVNVHGRVLPVLDVRQRFLLPHREIRPADWFLIAHTARHTVVLVVDESEGLVERLQADIVASTQILPRVDHFPGVVKLDDGLGLIHDLETFLTLDESRALDKAMGRDRGI